jgi:diguanylate cyclase (GGDEF)-like protein/PAS domain S-box-containing protein
VLLARREHAALTGGAMRLRAQVVLGVAVVAAVVVTLLFTVVAPYMRSTFAKIERGEAQQNLDRARNVIAAELIALESTSHDWAAWDDTFEFVQRKGPQFVEDNLIPDTFTNLRLNLMAFFDVSGKLEYVQAFDLEAEAPAAPSTLEMEALQFVVPAPRRVDDTESRSGLLSYVGALALVAVHPILASPHEAPARGTLVILRTLNAAEIDLLTAQVRLPLAFRLLDDPGNDPNVVKSLLGGDPTRPSSAIVPVDETTVAGYALLRDLHGEPVAVLGVEMPRDTYLAGVNALRYLIIGLVALFVVVAVGFLVFTDRRVLARSARLASSVTEIGRNQDPVARVTVEGRDEIGSLAASINGMLGSIAESRAALERSEKRYHTLFEASRDPIYITTEDGHFVDVNPALLDLFGYTQDEIMGMTAGEMYARPEDREGFREAIAKKGFVVSYPVALRRKDGALVRCLLTTITEKLPGTEERVYQGIIRDVTELLRQQEELTYLATHDPLTGLLTRSALHDVLTLEIARAMRNLERLAVFYLDLDRFKQVNDIHGHEAGDRVLREVAARLREALRASDTVARLGGDEFVALLPGIDSPRDAELAAEKILGTLRDAFHAAELARGLSVSIGIALYPDDGDDGARLLQLADAAMYNVKNRGRNGWKRYDHRTNAPSPA